MGKTAFEDLEALLLLNRTPGIRMRGLMEFFEQEQSPAEILKWIRDGKGGETWRGSLEKTLQVFDPVEEVKKAAQLGIELISFQDERYPALLKEISDPPLLLYVLGDLLPSDQAAVSVVGSRHPSFYGLEQARRFSQNLSRWGVTVISGFARGIDRASHEAALEISYGRTIAVLGSGLDVIYPKEHQTLYDRIREKGALLSEFAFGTPPLAENFPKRNRIIAGLALGVLVVEAHSRSGSLITAHIAAEEGREVFAIPGRVDQLGSRGTHSLLKEGAYLAESPEELLQILAPQLWPTLSFSPEIGREKETAPEFSFNDEERQMVGLLASPLTLEELARQGRHSIPQAAALLSRLELRGAVRKHLDGRFERVYT